MIDLDLFAGPGGWDQGATHIGLHPLGVEWDHAACRTAVAAGHARVRADVARPPFDLTRLRRFIRGLIASPPCTPFTKAGKGAGNEVLGDLQDAVERVMNGATPLQACPVELRHPATSLVLEPVRYARDLQPEWIALEQVPSVQPIWQALRVLLRQAGYSCWVGTVNAADYGVPQTRQRTLLLASRVRQVQPPEPTHSREGCDGDLFGGSRLKWVSMADALGWGMSDRPYFAVAAGIAAGGPDGALLGGSGARQGLADAQRSAHWVTPEQLATWGDRPATTVVGSFSPDVIAAPGYRTDVSRQDAEGSVKVTAAEGGVLQSFPPDYPWQGSRSKQYEQVGNAVPPRLAAHALAAVTGQPAPF